MEVPVTGPVYMYMVGGELLRAEIRYVTAEQGILQSVEL